MITINGNAIPIPSSFGIGIQDISKAERNARGTMIIERITTKRKLELGWSYLSKTDLAALLTAVSPVTFTVVYPDAQTGANRSGTFYCGDRSAGMIDYRGGIPRYKDVKFSLIEC
ncbi:hypothetical protein LPY66_18150 [Dehalobacter sp. DCM]|uniref:DUF6711 family protein n=1 Tax=Dehalobacter sp. DCM TaxID=2907827 RepID=UPI0030817512|nr:hypothetical protein LPY66_18150 [Dehalobacter sp. DCM]